MVYAAVCPQIGVKRIECTVFGKSQTRIFIRVLEYAAISEYGIRLIVLVHVEVTCEYDWRVTGNLTNTVYNKFCSFTACGDTDVVCVQIKEIESAVGA